MFSKNMNRTRAVVVGGGIAGKLAARVLSEFFKEIILIEKDKKDDHITNRKGVPQGNQGHVLLKSGEEIIEELFPGIFQELSRNGAKKTNFARDLLWSHHGTQKIRFDSNVFISQQSRPLLEWQIQQRLEKIPNINFRFECKVQNLKFNNDEMNTIVIEDKNGAVTELLADIVIDASGAAALHNQWLKDSGYKIPTKTEIKVDVFYASMVFKKLSHESINWHSLLAYPNPPDVERGGMISPIEGNRMLVTLIGYGTKELPKDIDSFLEYAASVEQSEFYDVIKNESPLSEDVQIYRFPSLRRYHFEKLRNFPSGLLIIGDAFCRVDPVFAQGMSLAAMEAKALRELLMQGLNKKQLTKNYHKKVSRILDIPWLIALTEDFRFRTTSGRKPIGLPILQWYVKSVVTACSHNEHVYSRFIQVLHLKSHPISLAHPGILAKVFKTTK
ncbi:FAD-dependent oxidoreductase [Mesobacillus selenatarsenatis]|uniref:Putative secreted protein n=1 Tax=Mesobacillus selenatarsenatis (strain DSM 18680 / JCM 14380 / FERM P-15431 / SF-1) TaxID=1321606 RepID=A0A0A8X2M9_MESS1|nr:FAD-dependent monooxygenase [Mesobacillus selenatarsenatis]GAM13504.1 putative secreted protein [Mesobacillus selenatarsenatis SF-1]